MAASPTRNLMFGAPKSSIEIGFWEELYSRKLDSLKLNSTKIPITAELTIGGSLDAQSVLINKNSFSETNAVGTQQPTPTPNTTGSSSSSATNDSDSTLRGNLWNVNTIEEFKDLDKRLSLEEEGVEHVWTRGILREEAITNPAILFHFLLLTFADLKTYKFLYWYAAPAVVSTSSTSTHRHLSSSSLYDPTNRLYTLAASSTAAPSVYVTRAIPGQSAPPVVEKPASIVHALYRGVYTLMRGQDDSTRARFTYSCLPPVFMFAVDNSGAVSVLTLEQGWGNRFLPNYFVVVMDGSAAPGSSAVSPSSAGWGTRNLLALLAATVNSDAAMPLDASPESNSTKCQIVGLGGEILIKLLKLPSVAGGVEVAFPLVDSLVDACLAEITATATSQEEVVSPSAAVGYQSCIFEIEFSKDNELALRFREEARRGAEPVPVPVAYKVIGWETNERGKPGPKQVDMSTYLNPIQLLSQASNLNLKLMKWRLWEKLDIDKISQTKCLLLGAGTLGCAVARVLLGWGVKNITFVDNGRVSYSNPTRQCLYTFEDCSARKFKATAAAEAIKAVNPSCNCTGVVLTIPMPGHAINAFEKADTQAAHDELSALIRDHDVIYLLTDSREARWLPSVIYASIPPTEAESKILINVALGFDSYLVMRHGQALSSDNGREAIATDADGVTAETSSPRLGCYFCNDIIGVSNTLKDRTLDQQCTVTRPGLAYIASAWGVEMMVALLHVDPGTRGQVAVGSGLLSKDSSIDGEMAASTLGERAIPHQMRGSLVSCTQVLPIVSTLLTVYECCVSLFHLGYCILVYDVLCLTTPLEPCL